MSSCLIVSSLDKSLDALSQLLKAIHIDTIVASKSAKEAKQLLNTQRFDLVLINTPLADEFGHEITMYAAQNSTSGVVMLIKKEILEDVSNRLNKFGVMCIGKPLDRQVFTQAISMALSTHRRISNFHDENIRLHEKVENIQLISRAKYVLIEYLNMSEVQAHRYIEKKAMDKRVSKEMVAKEILKTYG
ncbi:AmiR/NasT family two-component response regulator [Breznakia sp. PF5-3]|uniref:ANTAR domain-containing response regulator n=1 Tax=unclassified Breznakia TaxID=2623764 RepID=UPI002406D51C|nr:MULTISPECIES: ANTAR domain-containing protein [unclassified Breznakia]MDF9825014.1 AmiR/NasT family two-component response regulator [Breznakia sp. PM6-1]MDF9835415.1 AmiR/NasT family two-component response regulator [Breznakia sp. PF5-3]MDF9837647.1 AmiR/NasT family two-component response regulator [Breznakia sp. PFB2-8]MDF9859511.1 AmiR/NasT family two-component response regulator [Breznakia sp. PH5-24]